MSEVTFLLAVLVNKEILTLQEALALKKSLTQSITNANLSEMITKVSKALEIKEDTIKTVDASKVLN